MQTNLTFFNFDLYQNLCAFLLSPMRLQSNKMYIYRLQKEKVEKARFVCTTLVHYKNHGIYIFILNEVCIYLFSFSKIGPKISSKASLCPHWCLELWYTILKNVTWHIYILLKYINCVPVPFSFLGFDICAQKAEKFHEL